MARLGEFACFFSRIAGYKHLASGLGKTTWLAVGKVRTGGKAFVARCKTFIARRKVFVTWCKALVTRRKAALWAGCKTGVVVKTAVVWTVRVAVIETGTVSVVVALRRWRTTLEGAATVVTVAGEAATRMTTTKTTTGWLATGKTATVTTAAAKATATTTVIAATAEITAWAL